MDEVYEGPDGKRTRICRSCGHTAWSENVRMNANHDSACCVACDIWLEPPCDCHKAEYVGPEEGRCTFGNRPERPSMVKNPVWWR